MQLRSADLSSVGPSSQKLWPKYIFAFIFPCILHFKPKKNKDTVLYTFFRPNPNGKIVQNGKIHKNPTGSSHKEQLEPKRLTLEHNQVTMKRTIHFEKAVSSDQKRKVLWNCFFKVYIYTQKKQLQVTKKEKYCRAAFLKCIVLFMVTQLSSDLQWLDNDKLL